MRFTDDIEVLQETISGASAATRDVVRLLRLCGIDEPEVGGIAWVIAGSLLPDAVNIIEKHRWAAMLIPHVRRQLFSLPCSESFGEA